MIRSFCKNSGEEPPSIIMCKFETYLFFKLLANGLLSCAKLYVNDQEFHQDLFHGSLFDSSETVLTFQYEKRHSLFAQKFNNFSRLNFHDSQIEIMLQIFKKMQSGLKNAFLQNLCEQFNDKTESSHTYARLLQCRGFVALSFTPPAQFY